VELSAYQLLYDNIHDFKTTAMHVESEIRRHGIRSDSDDTVPKMQGRRHREMWVSMKTGFPLHSRDGVGVDAETPPPPRQRPRSGSLFG